MSLIHILAQAAVMAAPQSVATQGVIAYPPEYFAASRPANVREMLERVPGFSFDGGDGVRGYEGAAGNVLVNGQRMASKTDNLDEILRRMPFSKVAKVELIRGGAPGIDMQGKSVIANVVLKEGGGFHGLVAAAFDSVPARGYTGGAVRLEGSGEGGGRSWELGYFGCRCTDDGAGNGPEVRTGSTGQTLAASTVQSRGFQTISTLTGAYELPAIQGRLRSNIRLSHSGYDYDETNREYFPSGRVDRSHQNDDTDETELGLRYSRDFGSRLKLELVGLRQTKLETFHEIDRGPGSLQDFRQQSDTAETIGRGVVKFTQTQTLSWELGGEGAFNSLDNKIRFVDNGALVQIPAANVQVEEARWEVFGKATWRPVTRLTLEASVRQEGSNISSAGDVKLDKDLSFTKPRLSATWAANDATQVRLRLERTVGQLNFTDFTASSSLNTGVLTAGNPNLSPEQAWVSEIAFERRFLGSGVAGVTLRHSALTDVIDRAPVITPTSTFDAPANIGQGTKDEVILGLTLPFDRVGWKGAQLKVERSWTDSEVTDPTTHLKRPISNLRPQHWEAHLTWDLPQQNLNLGVDVYGAIVETYYRFDQIEVKRREVYAGAFAEWKPQPSWSVRLELNNLTARALRDTRYVASGARSAHALSYVDDRDLPVRELFHLRIRKTFG